MHIENQSKSNHITLEELLKEKHKFGFNDLVSFRKGKKKRMNNATNVNQTLDCKVRKV